MKPAGQPQYLSYYGLTKPPFRLSPDPEFFFPSSPHLAAKEVLSFAIRNDEGFMVLIGEAGSGKTLLLRLLLEELAEEKVIAVLLCPAVSPSGLMHLLLEELGEHIADTTESAVLLKYFQQKLLSFADDKKELLIVVDEAQNLPVESMEQLRMLSNIETGEKKLLQILFTGQPELGNLLKDSRLGQLAQRIVIFQKLRLLTKKETMEYVNFRLARAGKADLFLNTGAQKRLFAESEGIPRLINRLMDRSMLFACADQANIIQKKHIKQAADTLTVPEAIRRQKQSLLRKIGYTLLICSAAVLSGTALFFLKEVW